MRSTIQYGPEPLMKSSQHMSELHSEAQVLVIANTYAGELSGKSLHILV